MRTPIQRALHIELGDEWFFSNQLRIRSGARDSLSLASIVREVVGKPGRNSDKRIYLSTASGPLLVSRDVILEKYSPNLNILETAINRVQKIFILLAYHGFYTEAQELLVQVEL